MLAFCKVASDSDDELEIMWEEYLHKLREIKEDMEDKENARLENERDEKLNEEANDERWRIWKEE
jgi:hypothetical protein